MGISDTDNVDSDATFIEHSNSGSLRGPTHCLLPQRLKFSLVDEDVGAIKVSAVDLSQSTEKEYPASPREPDNIVLQDLPHENDSAGTIRIMREAVRVKQSITVPSGSTGMPKHLNLASEVSRIALDVLALSDRSHQMTEETLRIGIWNTVPTELSLLPEYEMANFMQMIIYLSSKSSTTLLLALDFALYLLGYYKIWDKNSTTKSLQYKWDRVARSKVYDNIIPSLFDVEGIALILSSARNFMKEQPTIHTRIVALKKAFDKEYVSRVPGYTVFSRKIMKRNFNETINYWEAKRKEEYKRLKSQ